MAVVFEGFSIRKYASKMRSIDVVKCWPFSGVPAASSSDDDDDGGGGNSIGNSKIKKETMESLLPPIKVTKFRWWSEELDRLKSTELANLQSEGGGCSSSMEKGNHKFQEKQPRIQSDLLQVNLHVEEKSDERLDMLECPVCGAFAASTVNALNAHVDSCLAQASREERRQMRMAVKATTKSRTPKKRSIVEIFAAAPQIHKVDDDDNLLDEDERGTLNCKIERLKKKKKKKKKVAAVKKHFENTIVKKLIKKKRKLKKNKNKNMKKDWKDGLIANKENGSKLKLQTPVNFNRKPSNSLCNRDSNPVSVHRKKPSLKCLSAKKKNKVVHPSKPIVEHEKPISPVRGILKDPTKLVSGQNAAMCNIRATKANNCGIQHSVRHVSFSGEDEILGPHKKRASTFEKRICHVDLDPVDLSKKGHWIEGDKEYPAREINGNDDEDVSFSTENEMRVQTVIEKQQFPDIHQNADIPNFLGPPIIEQEMANNFSDKPFPPGQVVLDSSNVRMSNQGSQTTFYSPLYAGVPRLFSAVKEIESPFAGSQLYGGVSTALTSSSLFVDYFGNHTQEVSAISSKAPRASLQPSSSGFALSKNVNESTPFTSQFATEKVSGHALSHQALHHLSSIELIGRLYPFPEWKQNTVAFREKYGDEEFVGLPLNSQGELVQAKSSGEEGFSQLKKSSPASGSSKSINNPVLPRRVDDHSIMKGKHSTENAFPNNQVSLFPAQNQMKENATVNSPARLGPSQLESLGKDVYSLNSDRECNHSCLMDSDLNMMSISFSECGQFDQFQDQKEKRITHARANSDKMLPDSPPPTMRLMGKDVPICRSRNERQGFADGKVWTDKEIIREHHPQGTALQSSYVDRHFQQDWILNPASENFKETPVQRLEMATNQAFPSNVLTKPLESNFFQPGLNWQANPEFHSSSLRNPNPNSHHFAHPLTSPSIFDNRADFQDPFISRNETLRVSSQLPSASTSHRIHQNIHGSSVELKYKQNLPNAVKSSFNFPFLHPDHGEHVQPSWFRESSRSLIPWLLQATQQVKAPCAAQPFPDIGGRCHPHATQTSFLANPLVPNFPIVSCKHSPMITYSHRESPIGHPIIAHSPVVPGHPGIKPTSVNMSDSDRMKVKDRMKLKSVGIQDPDIFQKTRKRPGVTEDHPLMKPFKIPNLGILDESRAPTRLTRENFIDDIQCNTGSLEIEPYRDQAGLVGWIPNESQCHGFGTSAGIDSSKVDSVARHGPIKLSAGVKHILKPSQNVDQDSRLIHSTIPFASVTDCGSILETQKKSTKIYRF